MNKCIILASVLCGTGACFGMQQERIQLLPYAQEREPSAFLMRYNPQYLAQMPLDELCAINYKAEPDLISRNEVLANFNEEMARRAGECGTPGTVSAAQQKLLAKAQEYRRAADEIRQNRRLTIIRLRSRCCGLCWFLGFRN